MIYIRLYEEYFESKEIKTEEQLTEKLIEYGIPVENWGIGGAKTIHALLNEIKKDDCIVIEGMVDGKNTLIRYIQFVGIQIFYNNNGQMMKLKEDRQVFKDGRERRRIMTASVGEKMIIGENKLLAAVRGIAEELSVTIYSNQLTNGQPIEYKDSSQSYPGLETVYEGFGYNCTFNDEQYNPEGYVENQEDKDTYFVWVPYNKTVNESIEDTKIRRGDKLICKKDKTGDLVVGDVYTVNNVFYQVWKGSVTLEGLDGEYPLNSFDLLGLPQ